MDISEEENDAEFDEVRMPDDEWRHPLEAYVDIGPLSELQHLAAEAIHVSGSDSCQFNQVYCPRLIFVMPP